MKDRIKSLRKTIGLTQTELGKQLGVSRDAIAGYERGVKIPEPTIRLICMEHNVNESWLRTGEGQMFNELSREEAITKYIAGLVSDNSKDRDFEKRFFRAMASLSKEQWLVVQEIMDKMVEDNEKS